MNGIIIKNIHNRSKHFLCKGTRVQHFKDVMDLVVALLSHEISEQLSQNIIFSINLLPFFHNLVSFHTKKGLRLDIFWPRLHLSRKIKTLEDSVLKWSKCYLLEWVNLSTKMLIAWSVTYTHYVILNVLMKISAYEVMTY